MKELADKEKVLFLSLKSRKNISLDEIVNLHGGSRHAMIIRIKYLAAKIAQHGWIIHRISGIGRGKKAVFSMEKKF